MKTRLFSALMVILGVLGLLVTVPPAGSQTTPAVPDLTILYTNDVWGYLEPCG